MTPGPSSGRRRHACSLHLLTVLLALCATACDRLPRDSRDRWCELTGICDAPPKSAEFIDVLCDSTTGSSCSPQTLERTLEAALRHEVERPGSRVRLWMLGKNVAQTVSTGEQIVPPTGKGSER